MFRVYDRVENQWVTDNIYLAQNDDVFVFKKTLFRLGKPLPVSSERYVYHRDIGLYDKNGVLIFEGDICKATEPDIIGVVAYAPEHACYYLFDEEKLEYYNLGTSYCERLEIVGNVFEDNKESM